jgi:energy-coupling factor transport system ATP-binding protein
MTLAVQQAEQQFVTLQVDKELNFPKEPEEKIKQKQLAAMKTLGIDHVRERSLYQLSEGQKKMIQLIAMLSLDCTFLLLDEPFTGLDERACQFFVKWLEDKKQRTSLLIVSHRLEPLVGVSDHHVHLANQQLQEVDD